MQNQTKRTKTTTTGIILLCVLFLAFLVGFIFQDPSSQQSAKAVESEPAASQASSADKKTVDKSAWYLMLVSAEHPMPSDYLPELEKIDQNGHAFDKRAANALKKMLSDAKAAGLSPIVCSSYRSVEKQTSLFQDEVAKQKSKGMNEAQAQKTAATVVAYPGTSEHNLGLAADIVSLDYQILDEAQKNTPEAKWLKENCSKYGFIVRYPDGKSDKTGVIFEPWHYRYVGEEAAKEIMQKGLCLEEYLDQY